MCETLAAIWNYLSDCLDDLLSCLCIDLSHLLYFQDFQLLSLSNESIKKVLVKFELKLNGFGQA